MNEQNGQFNTKVTRFPIQIPNDARYIDSIVDYIRNVIKPDQLVRVESHWDYYLGEAVEFVKEGVSMAYDWNESWGHELTTNASDQRELMLTRATAEQIAAHVRQLP